MKCKSYLLFSVLILFVNLGNAQVEAIRVENVSRIDSLLANLNGGFCGLIRYDSLPEKKVLRNILPAIDFINIIFDQRFDSVKILHDVKNFKKKEFSTVLFRWGPIRFNTIILNGKYLRAVIRIETINEIIVRTHCSMQMNLYYGRCGFANERLFHFKFLKEHLLNRINFLLDPIYNEIQADSFNLTNLKLVRSRNTEYRFSTPSPGDPDWLAKILLGQYETKVSHYYSYDKADPDFVNLIRNNKIELIRDLLFSANYIYAINAMEAIEYLANIGKITIDNEMKLRISQTQSEKYFITISYNSDHFGTADGYSALHTKTEQVISKYRIALE